METSIEYYFEIFSLVTSTHPPTRIFTSWEILLVRISSLTKRKTHCSPPPPPWHSQEDFSLVRISSLTKRKTHGCPKKLPRVFLFVKEEILTGLISLWVGEREGIWGFPLWRSKKPNWNLKRISLVTSTSTPSLPQGFFPLEDLFLDEKKNS